MMLFMSTGQVHLREFTRVSKADRIDREAGIIYGLAILGPESANGRRYSEAAMRSALGLYEGRPSNANHVRGTDDPNVYDRLGIWYKPRLENGQIKGDFHYAKTHPLAERLLEAAERPDLHNLFGFSHDALGSEKPGSNGSIIESIDRVHYVDLVADPATVKGVWESRMTMLVAAPIVKNKPKTATGQRTKKTFRTILTEALAPVANRKKRRALASWLKEMSADDYMAPDEPLDTTPGAAGDDLDAEPPAHGKELMAEIVDLIDKCLETADKSSLNPDYLDKLEAIKDIAASHGAEGDDDDGDDDSTPGGSGTPDANVEDDDKKESKKKKAALAAQLQEAQAENKRLKREGEVRKLCDAADFVPTETQLKALLPLADVEAKALIENLRTAKTAPTSGKGQKAKSQAPGGFDDNPHPGDKDKPITESFKREPNETDEQYRQRRVRMMRSGNF